MTDQFALPRIKVCGMTRTEDLAAAVTAGADAVGFVQYAPSPRSIRSFSAVLLSYRLPDSVTPIGVFVDEKPEDVLRWARQSGSRAVQLCGTESATDFAGFPLPILRRLAVEARAQEELQSWSGVADGFVLDHPGGPGGTGQAVDWDRAAALAEQAPCLLAGGLDENNVAEAIRHVKPAGVDASSRLERDPGQKDPARVKAFVDAALRAWNGGPD